MICPLSSSSNAENASRSSWVEESGARRVAILFRYVGRLIVFGPPLGKYAAVVVGDELRPKVEDRRMSARMMWEEEKKTQRKLT